MLLVRLSTDSRVDKFSRALLLGVIAYFVLPFDVFPEGLIGPGGLVDDLLLASWAVRRILIRTPVEVIRSNWSGPPETLDRLDHMIGSLEALMGGRLRRLAWVWRVLSRRK